MAQSIRTTRRLEAWRFARTAIRAYEREQNPSSTRQVELAMRYLRESQAGEAREALEQAAQQEIQEKRRA
ncbi:MAG TPA: hypothetical protein VKN76_14120 [Kiloniellaceae bacterium]|nr:hypothetical protein [Kiloniellaceae bacterium]